MKKRKEERETWRTTLSSLRIDDYEELDELQCLILASLPLSRTLDSLTFTTMHRSPRSLDYR